MKLYYNGTDIYRDVSVNYCVHEMYAEKQADTLVIRFNDTKGLWSKWNPAPGDTLRLEEGACDSGKMFIHFISSQNGFFTVRAMSMPLSGKTKKSKTWEGVRFFQIGNEIAHNLGLTFKNYGCTDHVYKHLKQENETDPGFFRRICTLEGYQMLIYDGALLAYNEHYIESLPPTGALEIGKNGIFEYSDNRANCYGSCEISSGIYFGRFSAPGTASTAVLRPEMPIQATSTSEAARFAKGLLRNANKYGRSGKFSKSLLLGYAAASVLDLKTEKASAWNGTVFIYKVRHDFVDNKSTVYFREPLEGY